MDYIRKYSSLNTHNERLSALLDSLSLCEKRGYFSKVPIASRSCGSLLSKRITQASCSL